MSRSSRKRASRTLFGVLGCTIVIGSFFYFRNTNKTKAADRAPEAASTVTMSPAVAPTGAKLVADPPAPAKPADPEPIVTITPTGIPSPTPVTERGAVADPNAENPFEPGKTVKPFVSAPPNVVLALNTATTKPTSVSTGAPAPAPLGASVSGAVPTLAEAKAKLDAGQMLAARNAYNAALVAGKLSPTDAKAAKAAIAEINRTVVFSPRRFNDDAFAGGYVVKPGDRLQKIAADNGVPWEFLGRINNLSDPRKMRAGQTLKLVKGPFHAVVSKGTFTMDLYLGAAGGPGSMYVTSFAVGLGADDSTPTGTWAVKPQSKLKNPTYYSPREDGERIVHADDPKNPLGEYWMGLVGVDGHAVGKESYGIHGTIEPDSIGKMASLGCIRLLNENIAQVFDMLVEGKSTVVVTE